MKYQTLFIQNCDEHTTVPQGSSLEVILLGLALLLLLLVVSLGTVYTVYRRRRRMGKLQ